MGTGGIPSVVLVGNRHITLFAFEVFSVQLGQEWYFHTFPVFFFHNCGQGEELKGTDFWTNLQDLTQTLKMTLKLQNADCVEISQTI